MALMIAEAMAVVLGLIMPPAVPSSNTYHVPLVPVPSSHPFGTPTDSMSSIRTLVKLASTDASGAASWGAASIGGPTLTSAVEASATGPTASGDAASVAVASLAFA